MVSGCSSAPASSRASRSPRSGSGDAFLAGYLAARYEGRPPDQCLRFGVACGAESTARLGHGLIDAARGATADGRRGADGHRAAGRGRLRVACASRRRRRGAGTRGRRRTAHGTAYSAQTHTECAIGAQSVGVRSSPCQAWNCVGEQVGLDAFQAGDLGDDEQQDHDPDRAHDGRGAVAGGGRQQHPDARRRATAGSGRAALRRRTRAAALRARRRPFRRSVMTG